VTASGETVTEAASPRWWGWCAPSCLLAGLISLAVPVAGATVLGFFGQAWWVFDLLASFRLQYTLFLLVVTVALGFSRRWGMTAVVGSFVLVNLVPLAPYYVPHREVVDRDAPRLRVLSLNVNDHRSQYEPVLALIGDVDADVVVLIEVDERWVEAVSVLARTYPYQVMALLSKYPLEDSEILTLGRAGLRSISTRVQVETASVELIATHPYPPVTRHQAELRNDQLGAVGRFVATLPNPVVLVGDLNATPWSLPLRRLIRETGLRDSALGRGVQPSWPAGLPLLRAQIDNCLVSPDLAVVRRTVGPNVDSDHLPLIAELALTGR
jgi:endonuclease/exonuclease/phosphatase (EEP) superfamily protein YafD